MLLDVGRHFFSVPFIKKFLDVMALHKCNVFHWHLTEDQVRKADVLTAWQQARDISLPSGPPADMLLGAHQEPAVQLLDRTTG